MALKRLDALAVDRHDSGAGDDHPSEIAEVLWGALLLRRAAG